MAGSGNLCGLCHRGKEAETTCGELYSAGECTAHHKCMQYSSGLRQYTFKHFGGFKIEDVVTEIRRGRKLACKICSRTRDPALKMFKWKGATSGCSYGRCSKSFHYYCVAHSQESNGPETYMRYVQDDHNGGVLVKYRVFCRPEHKEIYEKNEKMLKNNSDDDSKLETSDENFSSEDAEFVLSDFEDPTPVKTENEHKPEKSKKDSGKAPQSKKYSKKAPKSKQNSEVSSQSDSEEVPNSKSKSTRRSLGLTSEKKKEKRKSSTGIVEKTDPQSSLKGPKPNSTNGSQRGTSVRKSTNKDKSIHRENTESSSDESVTIDDCLLYFVEGMADQNVMKEEISQLSSTAYEVSGDNVFNWQMCVPSIPLTRRQILYFTKALSEMLKDKLFDKFASLLCNLSTKNIDDFNIKIDFDNRLEEAARRENLNACRVAIDQNLAAACTSVGNEFASLYCWEEEEVYVTVVKLNNTTDKRGEIRRYLRSEEVKGMFIWDTDTKLSKHSNYLQQDIQQFKKTESDLVKQVIGKFCHNNDVHVISRPEEETIQHDDPTSIVTKLRTTKSSNGSSKLVLLGPVDANIVNQKLYYKKALELIVEDNLKPLSDMMCAVDLCDQPLTLQDIVPANTKRIPEVSCAFDPAKFPVTCLLLHFGQEGSKTKRSRKSDDHGGATGQKKFKGV